MSKGKRIGLRVEDPSSSDGLRRGRLRADGKIEGERVRRWDVWNSECGLIELETRMADETGKGCETGKFLGF